MFKPCTTPRVYAVPIGTDFSKSFVSGLFERAKDMPAQNFANITIYVNTRRAARRIETLFAQQPATILPRLQVLSDLSNDLFAPANLPLPTSPLKRRLILANLVAALIDFEPDLAPRSSVFALADSLGVLLDEMHGEAVPLERLENVDVDNASEHWERSLKFLNILTQYWASQELVDTEARQRAVIEAYCEHWKINPPTHPIIVAGSTGSRGATALFMNAVANLPQGAVVLPGVDLETPSPIWEVLTSPQSNDDHPQSMLARLTGKIGVKADALKLWAETPVFSQDRNRLLSLALRPAPVTDQWLDEGPNHIHTLAQATKNISMISANSPKEEATAIALCLRAAAENDTSAVLISPDRNLTRRVSAQLARWKITPDDSAGEPLHLTPAGIFIRLTADLLEKPLSPASLISVLKHPLTHKADERPNHMRLTRDLELARLDHNTPLIRGGPPIVDFQLLQSWAEDKPDDVRQWVAWLENTFSSISEVSNKPMSEWITMHSDLMVALSKGSSGDEPCLWDNSDGQEAEKIFESLRAEVNDLSQWGAYDYAALLGSLLKGGEVRDAVKPHPNIAIWGTLEARVQGADLVIMAGLNEGVWPQKPTPDPWLNRSMRKQLGLLLPERKIGLSAHDFQQGFAQKNVILSRSIRDGEAPTVASRWLTRLDNLMMGLGQTGKDVQKSMSERGDVWLALARQLDRPTGKLTKAERPSPVPPKGVYPHKLSVTRIKTLVRNPYEIYAKSILNLHPLKPYGLEPDALERGIILHSIVEAFSRNTRTGDGQFTPEYFLELSKEILSKEVPWPSARRFWYGHLQRIAHWFVEAEKQRNEEGVIIGLETTGIRVAEDLDFKLTAQADRLDRDTNGKMIAYDYKSGLPPGKNEIHLFDKQLQLEAAIAASGGFENIDPMDVSKLEYISLKEPDKSLSVPITDDLAAKTWTELLQLLHCHFETGIGYGARLKMQKDRYGSDYDHLSRFGEWEEADTPTVRQVP